MLPGFSTNSIGDLPAADAVPMLAELGYRSLALTPDHGLFGGIASEAALAGDALPVEVAAEAEAWRGLLARHGMACVVESGARHLLDPRRKHEPTLVSADPVARLRRTQFLERACDLAALLGASCVSLWSGAARDGADEPTILDRLAGALGPVVERAARLGVRIGFEPEPGMVIDTMARADRLLDRLGRPDVVALTVDLGHLECMGEWPLAANLARRAGRIVNVHVDDMRACRHDHLPLGTGDVDFPPLLAALAAAGYRGGLHVELPRQSHRWLDTAAESAAFLARHLAALPAHPATGSTP